MVDAHNGNSTDTKSIQTRSRELQITAERDTTTKNPYATCEAKKDWRCGDEGEDDDQRAKAAPSNRPFWISGTLNS
jgi:hypothetical protein